MIDTDTVTEEITGMLVVMAPIPIDDDTWLWARLTAVQIVKRLRLHGLPVTGDRDRE